MRHRLAVTLIAGLVLAGFHTSRAGGPEAGATYISSYRWQIPAGWFGGFSGLEITQDGTQILAVSDRGYFVTATLIRHGGAISRVEDVVAAKVLNQQGNHARKNGFRDSEGLVWDGIGPIFVAFEGRHRVGRFSQPGTREQAMPSAPQFDRMKPNGGFEALAQDRAGRLYAFPEVAIGPAERLHVFRLERGTWRQWAVIPRNERFQPVGADFGPDGRLYLLERGFNGLGFRVQVRSFSVSTSRLGDEILHLRKGVGVHDNLEGLSVWRDSQGQIRLTMISDDNFRFLQRTEIVEYVLHNSS